MKKKFEYKLEEKTFNSFIKEYKNQIIDYLNEMGSQGWELVSVLDLGYMNQHTFFWKKELDQQIPKDFYVTAPIKKG